MTKRTKIKYDDIKAEANSVFRNSMDNYAEGRKGIQSFVESLLMRAGQYKGFGYLSADKSAKGNSIGIEFGEDGKPKFFDQTRIEFL